MVSCGAKELGVSAYIGSDDGAPARGLCARAAQAARRPEALPRLLFLVTGRGPQRAAYLRRMEGLDLKRCAFRCAWLEAADYPALLGCADLGVCLHTSSSGLDLPMKVGGPPESMHRKCHGLTGTVHAGWRTCPTSPWPTDGQPIAM